MFGVCGRMLTFTLTDVSKGVPARPPRARAWSSESRASSPLSGVQNRGFVTGTACKKIKVAEMSEHLCICAAERLRPGCNAKYIASIRQPEQTTC